MVISGYSWDSSRTGEYDCVLMKEFIKDSTLDSDIEVYLYDDDWYIVECLDKDGSDYRYYKCDQIEGLINFLDFYCK